MNDNKSVESGAANFECLLHLLQDTIHVMESKPAKRYGDYFLRQIVKVCFVCILLHNFLIC